MTNDGHWTQNSQYINYYQSLKTKYDVNRNVLIAIKMASYEWTISNFSDYREDEQINCAFSDKDSNEVKFRIVLSERYNKKVESALGICKTTFILILLLMGSMSFSSDANTLILNPLERLMQLVNNIAINPKIAVELKLQQEFENIEDKNDDPSQSKNDLRTAMINSKDQ